MVYRCYGNLLSQEKDPDLFNKDRMLLDTFYLSKKKRSLGGVDPSKEKH